MTLRIRRDEELPVYERLGDIRARASALGKIADVLFARFARGKLDEALRSGATRSYRSTSG